MDRENPVYGVFLAKIDERGRVRLPAKIGANLPDELMLVRDPRAPCLHIYTHHGWQGFEHALENRFQNGADFRNWLRGMASNFYLCDFGQDGRLCVPKNLRSHAGLQRECTLVGLGDHLELWDSAEYEQKNQGDGVQSLFEGLTI